MLTLNVSLARSPRRSSPHTHAPGPMNISPRFCARSIAYATAAPRTVRHQRAVRAMLDISLPRLIPIVQVVQQSGATRVRQKLAAKADQPPRWDAELQPHPTLAVIHHIWFIARCGRRSSASRRPHSLPDSRSPTARSRFPASRRGSRA